MPKHVHIHLGRAPARDADGEGRWVTINGAAVFIKGGKITKGPPALVGKTHGEAHQAAGAEHLAKHDEAKKKGDTEQAERHLKASAAHTNAGEHYKAGNHALGDHMAKEAEKHAAATKTVHTAKPKPKAHEALHNEVAKGIAERGAKAHKEEHERLMKQYGESTADYQRSAVNRKMERNLVAANAAHADHVERKARKASADAHASGKHEDHQAAHEALGHAATAAMKYAGAGYAKKHEELKAMQKGHADKIREHEKAEADKKAAPKPDGKPAAKMVPAPSQAPPPPPPAKDSIAQQAHADAANTHRAKAKAYASPAHGQHEEGAAEVAKMHEEAAAHHEHMAKNPKEDHSARGAKLQALNKQIASAEQAVQTGKGGKPKPAPAKTPGKAPSGPAKGSGGQSSVQGATEAVKALKDVVKKAGEQADPDPKKQD